MDRAPGARPVTFQLEGAIYTVNLAEHNVARLREHLAPYIAAGRPSTREAN